MKIMKYLITGGAGFIGSHVAEFLVRDGHEVRILDNFSSGRKDNIASFESQLDVIEGDITDPDAVDRAVEGVDIVFHLAANPSVVESIEKPVQTHRINVDGTLHVFESARQHRVQRVVYASSSAVYGDNPDLPHSEEMLPRPDSFYALHKWINERHARQYYLHSGLESVGLRLFNVFGPRQDPHSPYSGVIPIFMDCYKEGKSPVIYGDGEQVRDYIYVKDVVRSLYMSAQEKSVRNGVFNVGTGQKVSLHGLIQYLNELWNVNIQPSYGPPRAGDVRYSMADITLIGKRLRFKPEFTIRSGLQVYRKSEFSFKESRHP